MNQFWPWALHSEGLHFALYYLTAAIIGGMPAPTKDSGVAYRWVFSSFNIVAANWMRAKNTAVENSPNFQAAVDIQTKAAGLPIIDVVTPPKP